MIRALKRRKKGSMRNRFRVRQVRDSHLGRKPARGGKPARESIVAKIGIEDEYEDSEIEFKDWIVDGVDKLIE